MQAIGKDEALRIIAKYCPDDDGSCSCAGDDLRNLLDEIEAMPTIEAEPVRHAKWYAPASYDPREWCSNCHERTRWFFDEGFCPNCGAKMEFGEEQSDANEKKTVQG